MLRKSVSSSSSSWKRSSADHMKVAKKEEKESDNISEYLHISPRLARKNQNGRENSNNDSENGKLLDAVKRRRKKKKKNKTPFPHTLEARDSLLHDVADRIKDKDFVEILQAPDVQGLVNLGFLILVAGTMQLILHNYFKHGFLIDIGVLYCLASDMSVAVFLWLGLAAFACNTYLLQRRVVEKEITRSTALIFHVLSLVLIYVVPITIIFSLNLAPIVSATLALCICVLSMKMHSYYATNMILEKQAKDLKKSGELKRSTEAVDAFDYDSDEDGEFESSTYPANVNFKNYLYFLMVPTLVYEPSYPRTDRVKWLYALKELLQCLGCFGIMYILLIQFILPIVKEHSVLIGYDLIRLSIPSIILWLLGFYAIFHCFSNFLSEVLRFADRQFYLDWWNAESLDVFWRKWNLLVHEWLHRHIYWESVQSGSPKKRAMVFTFLFSAFMHELIFWVMLKVIRPWFFLGMFGQIPLILMSKWLVEKLPKQNARRWGNIFVWCSLFVGQPLLEILYIREWFWNHSDFWCLEKPNLLLTLDMVMNFVFGSKA